MSRHEYDDYNDNGHDPSVSSLQPSSVLSRNRPRVSKQRTSRRYEQPRLQAQPIQGIPSPAIAARGAAELAPSQIWVSPPQNRLSPPTEIALLPGGGVEVPLGFHFDQADRGRYRSRESSQDNSSRPDQPGLFGAFGFGVFKNLKKLPAAIVRAGRGTKAEGDTGPTSNDQHNLQIDEDVETYITQNEEDEDTRAREEQLLRAYIERRRMRRDRVFRHSGRARREPYVPAPQPVPLPGSRTPVPSAAGYSDAIEAEEIEAEREALARAQERERARHMYAAEAVKPPSSASQAPTSQRIHRRAASVPLSPRVFSRWTAERDSMGRRFENRSHGGSASSTSPLTFTGLVRLIRQIRDLPWVGERVAADYIPGGIRQLSSGYTSPAGYAGSGSRTSYVPPVFALPPPPSQSWYTMQDSVLILPVGVAPPPGFIPYPGQYMPPELIPAEDSVPSHSSNTHIDMPVPVVASGPSFVEGESYSQNPAEASAAGQSYVFLSAQNPGGDRYAGGSHASASYISHNPRGN